MLIEFSDHCGVLKPAGREELCRPTHHNEHRNLDRPRRHKNDWKYPVIWWRGADGVDRDALNRLFPKIAAMV